MRLRQSFTFEVECVQPSGWSISFKREGDLILVGLHYGGKEMASHDAEITVDEFKQMSGILTS